jgi:pimeloyl-ACP methyl ester carboxylesterase
MSRDGTQIAFERLGRGEPLIMVCGALQGRATYRPLAEDLSRHLTVFNYDRRGRGDSGDTAPYAVEREVEDLGALIAEAGGSASVYGHSSGAALVLHAAARGLPIDKIVLHDPPFGSGSDDEVRAEQEEAELISALLAQDRRGDAVRQHCWHRTAVAMRSGSSWPRWGCRPRWSTT